MDSVAPEGGKKSTKVKQEIKQETTQTPLSIPRRASRKTDVSSVKKRRAANDSDAENSPATTRNTKRVRKSGSFDIETFMLQEREHRQAFEGKMLKHMEQGNTEYRKAAEDTSAFQKDFLGLLQVHSNPRTNN
jgi:hypothetical protein